MALNQAPIRIFDAALNFRAEISLYESAYYQRLDYGIGDFQIQINLNIPYADELVNGAYVQFDYDEKKIGVIIETTKKIGEKGKGDQILIVKGREAKYIFTQRLIIPPSGSDTYEDEDYAESALKRLVDFQAGSGCPDSNRELPDFIIDTDSAGGPQYYINERESILSDILEKLCLASEMGYYIYLDEVAKKFHLDVNFGTDHTAEQTTNGQVLFSTERNTIRKGELTESQANYKNVCYVAGEGQGATRNIRLVYTGVTEPTGWNRRETLLDVRQITANADMDTAGAKRLSETQYQVFANGQFLNYSTYVYGKNFDLGDYVTIKIYNQQQNVKITGVRESWSKGKYEIDFVYDKAYPQFNQTVTSRINGLQGILNNTEIPTFIGAVVMYGGSTAPAGWLICDGSSLLRAGQYAKLFAVIGTTFGSADGTHFSVPDFRGIFPSGAGTSSKLTNANGAAFARVLGTYQNDKMQGHYHNTYTNSVANVPTASPTGRVMSFSADGTVQTIYILAKEAANDGTNNTPRTGAETNPANLAVNFIIKF